MIDAVNDIYPDILPDLKKMLVQEIKNGDFQKAIECYNGSTENFKSKAG